MKDTIEHFKIQLAIGVAYLRLALSNLAEQPWFPKRKVIAGTVSVAIIGFLTSKLGLDLSFEVQSAISGGVAFVIMWLIPDRQS